MMKSRNKYYEVPLYTSSDGKESEYIKNVIVKKGIIYGKEIITNERIMICDNAFQGSLYKCYISSFDLIEKNIATLKKVKRYIDKNYEYSRESQKCIKKYIKSYKKERSK